MAQKKKAARAKKRAAARAKGPRRTKLACTALQLDARKADLNFRRTARAYVAKAAELEAAQAAKVNQSFYRFLAQGDSWFAYACDFSLIHYLNGLFGPEKAYSKTVRFSC